VNPGMDGALFTSLLRNGQISISKPVYPLSPIVYRLTGSVFVSLLVASSLLADAPRDIGPDYPTSGHIERLDPCLDALFST
jgi:hypothetical protein